MRLATPKLGFLGFIPLGFLLAVFSRLVSGQFTLAKALLIVPISMLIAGGVGGYFAWAALIAEGHLRPFRGSGKIRFAVLLPGIVAVIGCVVFYVSNYWFDNETISDIALSLALIGMVVMPLVGFVGTILNVAGRLTVKATGSDSDLL